MISVFAAWPPWSAPLMKKPLIALGLLGLVTLLYQLNASVAKRPHHPMGDDYQALHLVNGSEGSYEYRVADSLDFHGFGTTAHTGQR